MKRKFSKNTIEKAYWLDVMLELLVYLPRLVMRLFKWIFN